MDNKNDINKEKISFNWSNLRADLYFEAVWLNELLEKITNCNDKNELQEIFKNYQNKTFVENCKKPEFKNYSFDLFILQINDEKKF